VPRRREFAWRRRRARRSPESQRRSKTGARTRGRPCLIPRHLRLARLQPASGVTRHVRDTPRMKSGRQRAERMLTVSEVMTSDGYALVLDAPVFIKAGETFWTEGDDLGDSALGVGRPSQSFRLFPLSPVGRGARPGARPSGGSDSTRTRTRAVVSASGNQRLNNGWRRKTATNIKI
jgi:hypothetical protein